MRVAYTNGACCRWYFKFNGNECNNPATIEAVTYAAGYGQSYNLHRPRNVVGKHVYVDIDESSGCEGWEFLQQKFCLIKGKSKCVFRSVLWIRTTDL